MYRKDRVFNFESKISTISIEKSMGWCDDPKSAKYNKLIKFPFKYNAEKLYRPDNIYDIIIVLDFNIKPVRKNKGSAIFIHVARKNYSKTEGCIAVGKINLRKIIKIINKKTTVQIN